MNDVFKDLKKKIEESGNYSSKEYFTLKNDGDSATVIFLHGGVENFDLDYGEVYRVELPIEGSDNTIPKLVKANDPQKDPLARSGKRASVRGLFQLVEVDDDGNYSDVKIWERGPTHIKELMGFVEEFGPLRSYPIKIKRNGKRGDRNTRYQILPLTNKLDLIDEEELPEPTNLTEEGNYILTMTDEEMQKVVDGEYVLSNFSNEDDEKTTTTKKKDENKFTKQSKPNSNKKDKPKPPRPEMGEDGEWMMPEFNEETNEWYFPDKKKKKNVF